MQQALPQSIRNQKKINAKLMPPIKAPSAQDTSSGSGQQHEADTNKFQI
jgi:hypothetical protein